ncbi:hypothetical protein D5041_12470 [Verminephrobacter aporrectodeae subsp. tuberculatae]|uniref:hypothetical protein n=1 Tax=Verminephrobacter aporrectodeae TaxID=1110389 RepID=UPI0022389D72|nr:hypothetical protein [Verminephrobacter aporrectodeae]MCW5220532.1 hypothetical protein [Verminephrobacter aporrectodeae subsp. tuberculatae]MCW5289828.1 hypothetical protein [Verminephrobacter aporrectodeae subsp. tuberculatae]
MVEKRANLETASRNQDAKVHADAWGVFLIGVPFSKLSGDHEGEIATLKGEVEAIKTAQMKMKCNSIQLLPENSIGSTSAIGNDERKTLK